MKKTLINIAIGVAVAGVVYAIFFPVFATARESTGPKRCISNLKQLGTATQIYLADSDNRLPARTWDMALIPYTKNRELYTCDVIRKQKKRYGYAMNVAVVGMDVSTLKEPDNTVVYFEVDALAPGVIASLAAANRNRHGKGSLAVRADFNAKFYPGGPKEMK